MTKRTKNRNKGIRYTKKQRDEMLAHIKSYNAENGRGGMTDASKKFGVSMATLRSFMMKSPTSGAGSDTGDLLRDLANLADEIATTKAHLQTLQERYDSLRKSV